MKREIRTIEAMCRLYCRHHHGGKEPCAECQALLDYSIQRTLRCPFGEDKGPCKDCTVHCYRALMKDRIRAIMAWSGPRMLFRHPWLALAHLMDGWKQRGRAPRTKAGNTPDSSGTVCAPGS